MKRVGLPVLVCLLIGACVFSRKQMNPSPQAAAPFKVATEQEWIISEIAATILNVAALAADAPAAPAAPVVSDAHVATPAVLARFSIADGPRRFTIDVTEHVWAPAAFAPMAAELITRGDDPVDTDGSLRAALTRPTPETIQAQNLRLSHLLKLHPRSAALHEQAALLIGALALRENASVMSDPRQMMARMTAHLAVARALHAGTRSIDGQLAEALLVTLANREADALARLTPLAADASPAMTAWTRALRMRTTNNWRLVPDVRQATLLEQREVLRAARIAVGDTRSEAILEEVGGPADLTDWGRIMFHDAPSVGTGNRFAESSVEAEVGEALAVRNTFPDPLGGSDREGMIAALNTEPLPGPAAFDAQRQVWIIDWGTWAAASQRHLAAAIVCSSHHLRKMLLLPEAADAFEARSRELFGGLRLYPVVAREMAANGSDPQAFTRAAQSAADLARTRPDLITGGVWYTLFQKPAFAGVPAGTPASAPWFAPVLPAGTAYDSRRIYTVDHQRKATMEEIERLKALAPYDRDVVWRWVSRTLGEHASPEALQQAYGPLADYDRTVAWWIAHAADNRPEFYVPFVRRIAETLSVDDYYDLAEYLADHGRDAEAIAAFEHYSGVARDRVSVSVRTKWFVVSMFRSGQRTLAMQMGEEAAEVYSYGGLVAYASVLDMSGETGRAETLYRQAVERYGSEHSGELAAFLMRHQSEKPGYAREAGDLLKQLFPKGLEHASVSALTGAPDGGVRISKAGLRGEQTGLRVGDVIVAVDGVRVRDFEQYVVMKYQKWTPDMRFTIWRGGTYLDVPTTLRHQWIINKLEDYRGVVSAH